MLSYKKYKVKKKEYRYHRIYYIVYSTAQIYANQNIPVKRVYPKRVYTSENVHTHVYRHTRLPH